MNVRNQVIAVTGGARGIGLGIGRALAREGAKVVLADKLEAEAAASAEAIRSEGGEALAVACDISSPADNQAMVEAAVAAYGRLDGLAACAAVSRRGPFLDIPQADLEYTLRTSLMGTFYSLQAGAKQMVKQGEGGALLIIGSVHTVRHYPFSASYNMAKAGLQSLARTIAAELAEHRIRVNTIHPGWTDTPGELAFATREELDRGGAAIPFGRLATPEDIGQAALYLFSREASYVTGAELLVDGGYTLSLRGLA